jgi:inhibitor of KinA
MNTVPPYKIFPLGDSAITVDFGNVIDRQINQYMISLFEKISVNLIKGVMEVVPAYSSLTIYYDVFLLNKKNHSGDSVFEFMKTKLEKLLSENVDLDSMAPNLIRIPVCYEKEFSPDLSWLAKQKNISEKEIIEIHTATNYRVFMLGFLPGFAYLGEVDEKIAAPRKQQPGRVHAGSVGIAGRQTGIYPLNSFGGWQIIGRTPLKLFNATKKNPVLLKAGDEIQFYSITKDEFANYQTRNT